MPDIPAGHPGKQPRSPIEDDDEDEKEGKDEDEHEKDRIMRQRGFSTQSRVSTLGIAPKEMRPEGTRDRAY
jgi:hypothetical protein